ncbi:MAG: hypothetical protein RL033_5730 [Pseudomonadota bacterium]
MPTPLLLGTEPLLDTAPLLLAAPLHGRHPPSQRRVAEWIQRLVTGVANDPTDVTCCHPLEHSSPSLATPQLPGHPITWAPYAQALLPRHSLPLPRSNPATSRSSTSLREIQLGSSVAGSFGARTGDPRDVGVSCRALSVWGEPPQRWPSPSTTSRERVSPGGRSALSSRDPTRWPAAPPTAALTRPGRCSRRWGSPTARADAGGCDRRPRSRYRPDREW